MKRYPWQRINMAEKMKKQDAGTIFNPVMYLMILILTAQLLMLFVEYKRVTWVSDAVTDSMTDALLGACTLNETELYSYGSTDELEILYPKEKYDMFKEILQQELGLGPDMQVTDKSMELITDKVHVTDFRVYSVRGDDITFYDFDSDGAYQTIEMSDMAGSYVLDNNEMIENSTLVAEIGFTIRFFGIPVEVNKYHMVDVTN